ncbi:acyl carrier protein [Variovorax sp. YR216]|uniref:acyl carrier protein n=1 Tax=Variovorax sp. YR216 TaxID=1882828 RepID=UPI0008983930|nr:acyl carrier protein [Variovorax sp. YR216]SEA41796.1 acyl carrier protein [Variovorax sp. YR216]
MSSPTFETISTILENDFQVARADIQPDRPLVELGLDSLALMEFVFAVEDAFHLRIPEDKLDPREAGITLRRMCEVIEQAPPQAMAT